MFFPLFLCTGTTILQFLELCRVQLIESNFPNLKKMSADQLIYIKEDLIIPGDYTFYDLIKTKARGKSGPLFHFDVHEDLRVGRRCALRAGPARKRAFQKRRGPGDRPNRKATFSIYIYIYTCISLSLCICCISFPKN